ncbi:MAG: PEGA domain-containing protein [Lachnospiraceae bacterium]|nr:PEGA domain-containing protein [Lachnospiraceae bacterium]
MKIKGILANTVLIGMLACMLGGCAGVNSGETVQSASASDIGFVTMKPGLYDSEDTAIVVKKNAKEGTVQLQNLQTGKRYTLSYDGTTKLYDKYEQAVSMSQIKPGSIVTARFYKPKKALSYMMELADAICYLDLDNYVIDAQAGTISIGKYVYSLQKDLVILSNDREIEIESLNMVDKISVWGYNKQIYAINVEQGHGYLRLQNEDYFVGGWIEIGQNQIRQIKEDMLMVVPEGTSTVRISHKGSSASQEITFGRDEEMVWDVGDVEISLPQSGTVIFTVEPAGAKVLIDGEEVKASSPIILDYGVHSLKASAEGYDTMSQYIRVAEPSANLDVKLEKSEESEEKTAKEEVSDAEASKEAKEDNHTTEAKETESKQQIVSSTSGYRVYIDSPVGVEVYVDGNYLGIAPVDFAKEEGSYVISLRKAGYQTRSYTLQIDGEEKNVNYSFSELMSLE